MRAKAYRRAAFTGPYWVHCNPSECVMAGAHEKSVQRLAERKLLHRRSCVGWKDGVRRSRPRILVLTSRSRTVARVARRKAQGHVIAYGPILLSAAQHGLRDTRYRRLRYRSPVLSSAPQPLPHLQNPCPLPAIRPHEFRTPDNADWTPPLNGDEAFPVNSPKPAWPKRIDSHRQKRMRSITSWEAQNRLPDTRFAS